MFSCVPLRSSPKSPAWQADSATSVCMRCQGSFTLLVRRHHCRICGEVVCGDCSSSRVHRQRTCDDCVLKRLRAGSGSGSVAGQTAFSDDGWSETPALSKADFAYDADGNLRAVGYECDSGGVTSSADSLSSVVEAFVARQ